MTRISGIAIILVGLAFFVFGALPLVAIALALVDGKPIPAFGGKALLLAGGGIGMIVYGWQCVRGFKEK